MSWRVVELATNVLLVALVTVLGPLIKRFGRAYAGDIFRANPRTGRSYRAHVGLVGVAVGIAGAG